MHGDWGKVYLDSLCQEDPLRPVKFQKPPAMHQEDSVTMPDISVADRTLSENVAACLVS